MKRLILALMLLAAPAFGATQLYSEGFETAGWEARGFSDTNFNYQARTTNDPKSGSYALRGNFLEGTIDPIIGGTASTGAELLTCNFGGITASTPDTLYFAYWLRLDDANWAGVNPEGGAPSTGWHGKSGYFLDVSVGTQALYNSAGNNANPTRHTLASNGGAGMTQAWTAANWGSIYISDGTHSPATFSPDGVWHWHEYIIDYATNTITMYFDGNLVTSSAFPTGQFPIHESFKCRGYQFTYIKNQWIQDSTDGSGSEYACGWQLDDIEAWDGLPPHASAAGGEVDPPALTAPTNLQVSGGN